MNLGYVRLCFMNLCCLGIARCSHNQAVCFFASTVSGKSTHMGRPCSAACPKNNSSWGIVPGKAIPMGVDTPIRYAQHSSPPGTNLLSTKLFIRRHHTQYPPTPSGRSTVLTFRDNTLKTIRWFQRQRFLLRGYRLPR